MQNRWMLAGNWKMNGKRKEAKELLQNIVAGKESSHPPFIIAPPFPFLQELAHETEDREDISIAAQNCHERQKGAFTGEVSAEMLASCGVEWVILGHSERRSYFGETDALIRQKIIAALSAGLKVIYCCGENLEKREAGDHITTVAAQLEEALFSLNAEELESVIVAYEPVWAIGTGQTASPEEAQEMHVFIRNKIRNKFGDKAAYNTTILYGGSCKPHNAQDLFKQDDVDGGLIGGASLKADDFLSIASAFPQI